MGVQECFKGVVVWLVMIVAPWSYAQQDAQYTQYMYNTVSVNPAYAGSRDAFSIVGVHRNQWIGLEGAPRTNTLSVNFPMGYVKRIGLGVSVVNDVIGPSNETYMNVDFSYPVQVSRTGMLRFGLKAVARVLNINVSELHLFSDTQPQDDTSFSNIAGYEFSPNVGVGVYYYTEKAYFGLSAPNLFENNYLRSKKDTSLFVQKERIHYYVIGGYVFDINPDIKFKPAVLSKIVFGTPLQVDLSANFMFYEKFTAGVAYRWRAAVSALAGFQISNSIMAGFAYDMETTALGNRKYNGGSYEIVVRFELFKPDYRRWTPRFF